MELTIIGSGTAVPHPERVSAAHHVAAGAVSLLLDCGPGAVHRMAAVGIAWGEITHVAVSHFHTDHIGDLPMLLFALKYGLAEPRNEELVLLLPRGGRTLAERLASAFGDYVLQPGFPLRIRELEPGDRAELGNGVSLTARRTPHTDHSLAYRVDGPRGSIGYTGDTGPDPGQAAFFRGVDVLLAECSLPDELAMDVHLTPSRVAALAQGAEPGHLVLTHIYPQLERLDVAGLVRAAGWQGHTTIARDGLRLPL
ncbi:MAG TPA: MBL fold metallo-hydrolase [Longimicrobiales bacterium]